MIVKMNIKIKLKCNKCNNINTINDYKIYKCLSCNEFICELCKESHNKEHKLKEYIKNNFICKIHNQKYVSYCNKCKKDLCSLCEKDHINANDLINYKDMKPNNINDTEDEEFRFNISQFNSYINRIIEILNIMNDKINLYYKIYYNNAFNYDIKNINYLILNNINEISRYNIIIKNEIDEIINEVIIHKKINNLINLYSKIFNDTNNIIKYKIKKGEEKIKIFGNTFVNNNKDNCKIICDKKEYDLKEYFDINECKNDILEIQLKIVNNLKDMSYMFDNCSSLFYLSSNWNTSDVINMSYIFKNCSSLTTLFGISEWNTSNVNNIEGIFYNCISLSNLPDISKWNTNKITNMCYMFYNCIKLSNLPDISIWNTNNVSTIKYMFYNCSSLSNLPDISKWNTNNIVNICYMFFNCILLKSIPDISKWNVEQLVNIRSLFEGCSSLLFIPNIGKWNLIKIFSELLSQFF